MTVEDLLDALRELPPTAYVEVEIRTRESKYLKKDRVVREPLLEPERFTPLTAIYEGGIVTIALDEEDDQS